VFLAHGNLYLFFHQKEHDFALDLTSCVDVWHTRSNGKEPETRKGIMEPKTCPKCSGWIPNNKTPGAYAGAISRRDNKTEICSACGTMEALEDFFGAEAKALDNEVRRGLA
jgi:hypothetical protein